MNSTLGRMGRLYRVLRRAHGVRVAPLFLALFFGFLRVTVGGFMILDRDFFPRLKRTRATRPIVLVGNPRSGSTFLRRCLSEARFVAGLELFLMLCPSLTLQKLPAPALPLLEKLSPAMCHSTAARETSLTSVETDDVSILFR